MSRQLPLSFWLILSLLLGCRDISDPDDRAAKRPDSKTEGAVDIGKLERGSARQPVPSLSVVDRIEALLRSESCIDQLDKWVRRFSFVKEDGPTNTRIIRFNLNEAGFEGEKPGRYIEAADVKYNLDDRPIKMAFGDYDRRDNRIRFAYCGSNFGDEQSTYQRIKAYHADFRHRYARQ